MLRRDALVKAAALIELMGDGSTLDDAQLRARAADIGDPGPLPF